MRLIGIAMLALWLGALRSHECSAQEPARSIFVGAEVGSLLPAGVDGSYLRRSHDGRTEWGAELRAEPSSYLQSYSAAVSYYPFRGHWLVGLRGRRMQLHPSWSRGYDPAVDNQWAGSLETGLRWFPFSGRGTIDVSVGATYVSHRSVDLPMLFNVNVGGGWRVWRGD